MLVERNDWEMYAGLASGMMADVRLVPDDAPSPAALAPHG